MVLDTCPCGDSTLWVRCSSLRYMADVAGSDKAAAPCQKCGGVDTKRETIRFVWTRGGMVID